MHAVIRSYSGQGAAALFDLLEQRSAEIKPMMQSIPGFVSYALVRTGDGGITFTVCNDKAGTDESVRLAHAWIGSNAADLGASAPHVAEGPVLLHLS